MCLPSRSATPRLGGPAELIGGLGPRSRPGRDRRPRRRGRPMPSVEGMEIALITGASRGLGLALAQALADRGYGLAIDARGSDDLEAARTALARRTAVTAIAGDVADPAHREELVAAAVRMGRLRLLVNNASVLGPSPQPDL